MCALPTKRKRTPVSERMIKADSDTEIFMLIWERCMAATIKSQKVSSLRSEFDITGFSVKSWLMQSCRHRRIAAYITQVNGNHFMCDSQKETALEILYKTQRTYYGLKRFGFYLKKRSCGVTCDLVLEEIPEGNRVRFYDEATTMFYTFSRKDIIRLIYNALTYHDSTNINFFPRCIAPKNPYTNLKLERGVMYEIFGQLREVPMVLECYRRVGFSLVDLEKYHSQVLRRAQVDRYIHDLESDTFGVFAECYIEYINENVFRTRHYEFQFKPHPEFPMKLLHKDLRKPIEYYVRYIYMNCYQEKEECLERMTNFTLEFFTKYPRYGRKILEKNYGGTSKYKTIYCTIENHRSHNFQDV